MRAICAALEIDRLAVWGISGGGPHALACAALLPGLVVAAASLASAVPFDADGLDWFAGMGQANVDDFRLLLRDQEAARAKLQEDRAALLRASPDELARLEFLLTPADSAVWRGAMAEYLVRCVATGWPPASRDGGRTAAHTSGRGGSTWRISRFPSAAARAAGQVRALRARAVAGLEDSRGEGRAA